MLFARCKFLRFLSFGDYKGGCPLLVGSGAMAAVLHREETGTNVLLTVGYFGLTVYALYCRFGKSHPRTALIHKFCSVLAMGSAFRCFYFG